MTTDCISEPSPPPTHQESDQIRVLKIVFTLGLVALIAWGLVRLSGLLSVVFISYALAYVLDPFITKLETKGASRSLAFFLVATAIFGAIIILVLTVIPRLALEVSGFFQQLPNYLKVAHERVLASVEQWDKFVSPYAPWASLEQHSLRQKLEATDWAKVMPDSLVPNLTNGAMSTLLMGYSFTVTLLSLTLLPFFTYFLAVDLRRINLVMLCTLPKHWRKSCRRVSLRIHTCLLQYLQGQATVALILTVLYGVALAFSGIDLWFAISLISGLGSVIPYLGSLTGIILASLMSLVSFGTLSHLFLIWGLFAIIQTAESIVITPYIVGERTGLSPLAVLLVIFAGASLFGVVGVIFAIPTAIALRVIFLDCRRSGVL